MFVLVLVPALASRAAEPAAGKMIPDITYSTIGTTKLQLDLVVPSTPGPHPCVVCFHGGAWKAGSRKDLTKPALFSPANHKDFGLLETLARNGYAAASVSYRLAPQSKFPAQIEDAKTAVRFLRTNAKKYDLDVDRFGALGFSAGGHIAALLGTTDSNAGFDTKDYPNVSSRVQVVVDFFGPADLALYADTPGIESAFMVPLLGKECQTDPKCYKRASPIEYVTKDDPPVLILHGNVDVVVPIIHSENFKKKLDEVGVPNEFVRYKGKGHGWTGETVDDSARETLKFLNAHLKKATKP
jgi:acetyl esterase/lipase